MKNKNYQLGESISNPTSNKVRLVSRINNSQNRRLKKYPIRKLAKYMIDISPKRIYRWQISTWKDVQYYYPLEKCKLKP